MVTTIRVRYDGEVFRPVDTVDLQPNAEYVLTVQRDIPSDEVSESTPYPLTEISALATDMGIDDLSTRHNWYAHRRVDDANTSPSRG